MMPNQTFLVNKTDLFEGNVFHLEKPVLEDKEVLFEIERFSFTSNNITYAVVGETIGYWNFFQADEPNGIIPCWGYAKVIKSNNEAIKVGEEYYGYWPMSCYLKVNPENIKPFGFVDGTTHRKPLPPIYNFYAKKPESFSDVQKGYYSIIKPLFTTAFLNYGFLEEENFFDADQILLTSASSKTALGIAYMLFLNKEKHGKKIIGLTSAKNKQFLQETGFYDQVISYDDIPDIPDLKTTMVDLGGNIELLLRISDQLKTSLKFTSLIGLADWKSAGDMKKVPNSKFFFAPDYATKLFTKIGPDKANQLINDAQEKFTELAQNWMHLEFVNFEAGIKKLYLDILQGKVDPSKGYVVLVN
ncbi:DUF2855 family protein [Spongiivirga citrea]|uniref:DUF2855 family protein n=1 Tax=Spongiivirga citrea TaxID=1481457 RepID=A0A6M0CLX9_9FLAO|nr:DUF2855 family protein [Spongiivirga citrea]NER16447.1 DUF2855 family protein [Spongiivirga citrea]